MVLYRLRIKRKLPGETSMIVLGAVVVLLCVRSQLSFCMTGARIQGCFCICINLCPSHEQTKRCLRLLAYPGYRWFDILTEEVCLWEWYSLRCDSWLGSNRMVGAIICWGYGGITQLYAKLMGGWKMVSSSARRPVLYILSKVWPRKEGKGRKTSREDEKKEGVDGSGRPWKPVNLIYCGVGKKRKNLNELD